MENEADKARIAKAERKRKKKEFRKLIVEKENRIARIVE